MLVKHTQGKAIFLIMPSNLNINCYEQMLNAKVVQKQKQALLQNTTRCQNTLSSFHKIQAKILQNTKKGKNNK